MEYEIILFYKYVHIKDPQMVAKNQREICEKLGLKGRCIIAIEGINATFEGTKENIQEYIKELERDERFKNIHFKLSTGTGQAFPKLSVKARSEIVSAHLGEDNVKSYFGTGADASIYYDGTDLHIDSQEVGSGHIILDSPKTTTGDPSGVEGKIYWNTVDNVIKMYADGAWRTLVSW